MIDIEPATAAVLRAWKSERGALALPLARSSSVVFGNREGSFRHPETFSKLFGKAQERCARTLGEDALPRIRLHDLRHTHATLLLRDRESPNVVSERLGHASVTVTLSIYSHVLPGDQKAAAARFAALVEGRRDVIRYRRRYNRPDSRQFHGLNEHLTCGGTERPECGRGDSNPHGVATNRT